MTWMVFIVIFGYALLVLLLSKEALTYPKVDSKAPTEKLAFSIVINYHNEQEHLPALLNSIRSIDYDFQVLQWIFINDNSTDQSQQILTTFLETYPEIDLQLVNRIATSVSAKKDGITQAMSISKYDRILTTDADCLLPINWINSYNAIYHKFNEAHFIAAPVLIQQYHNIVTTLQSQEMMALQMTTIGGFSYRQPFLCNGANMSFSKQAFLGVDGYKGNDHISSGDDVFLLEKLAAEDVMKCHYLNSTEAVVTTLPKNNFKEMILQRARWAQKGSHTKSGLNKLISFQVLAMCFLFIVNPFLFLLGWISVKLFVAIILIKLFADAVTLLIANQLFNKINWNFFLINFFIYPFTVLAIALKSIGKPEWQGKKVNAPENQ